MQIFPVSTGRGPCFFWWAQVYLCTFGSLLKHDFFFFFFFFFFGGGGAPRGTGNSCVGYVPQDPRSYAPASKLLDVTLKLIME